MAFKLNVLLREESITGGERGTLFFEFVVYGRSDIFKTTHVTHTIFQYD